MNIVELITFLISFKIKIKTMIMAARIAEILQ